MKKAFLITIVMLFGSIANALDLTNNFNFEGVLLDNSDVPITGTVSVKFQIYDPATACLVFEETHGSVTPDTSGYFSLKIGTGTRNTGADGGVAWRNIFQNDAQVRAPGANCGSGYTPATGDGRKLRITVGGTVLTPDFAMSAVPMATVAESLQGKVATDFMLSAGAAGGDLSGSNSAPVVAQIQGRTVSATAPSASQVLTWTGSSWDPVTPAGASGTAGGDLSGTYPNPAVARIQGRTVSAAAPAANDVLVWNGSSWVPQAAPSGPPSGSAGGDLSGTYPNPTVAQLQGRAVSATAPSANQILTWNGGQWVPSNAQADSTKLPLAGGTMAGDINMGAYEIQNMANPTGAQSAATKNYVDTAIGSVTATGTASGDLSGTYPNPLVTKIQGRAVSATAPSANQVLVWNGSAWTPINPPAAPPNGSAGGDLVGGYPNPMVGAIQGNPVNSLSPSFEDVLMWNGSEWAPTYLDDYTKVSKTGDTMTGSLLVSSGGSPSNNAFAVNGVAHGMFGPSAGTVAFATTSIERMRITNTGNIGIGTNAPAAMLDVFGSVKIGGGGTPMMNHKFFGNLACDPGPSISAGMTGNCMVGGISGATTASQQIVACSPYGTPSITNMIYSCYISGGNQVTIVVRNDGGGVMTPPNYWNISLTSY